MKKIFTLLLALGSLTSVFAQRGHSDGRDDQKEMMPGRPVNSSSASVYNSGDHRYNNSYSFTARERDQQIREVNNDYDRQARAIKKSRGMRSYEKDRQLRQLEAQRNQKLRDINERFDSRWNTANDWKNRNDRKW